jgi:hypothetical protein
MRVRALVIACLVAGCSSPDAAEPTDTGVVLEAQSDTPVAIFPSCGDGTKNGEESDVDCGGGECAPCATSKVCVTSNDCAGVCRSGNCALASSCAEQQKPTSKNGIYDLDLDGDGPEPKLPFYCDMESDGGGYTLVYKLTSGVAASGAALWTASAPTNDDDRTLLGTGRATKPYVSRLVTKLWNLGFPISEVRVSVVASGKEAKFFRFDGKGSSVVNWFDSKRVLFSSYTDVSPTMTANMFSIVGDASGHREWFINREYGGCTVDAGWLVADWAPDGCMWESAHPATRVLYAPGTTAATWATGGKLADALLVYVK